MEIKRDALPKRLMDLRHNGMIKVVTGMRRCGKSYLLFNLFSDALKEGGVDDAHIVQVNLEDHRNKILRDPDKLLEYIDNRLKDDQVHYVILDEVQLVNEFEDVLNSYLQLKNADVYVTGSNARFLSKDVITEFRGRGLEVRIHPLSFREIRGARPEVQSLKRIDDSFQKIVIVGDRSARYQNDEGILFMDIYDFLTDVESVN